MGRRKAPDQHHKRPNGANPSRLDLALCFAEEGWAVVPLHSVEDGECSCGVQACANAGKHPRTRHGVKDATTDKNQIRAWWQENPNANIGIAAGNASGLLFVDVDPRHGGNVSLQALEEEYGAFGKGPRVRTGGKGEHIYLSVPPGVTVRSRVGLRPGVDVIGEGSYAVGVGSTHASGGTYLWQRGKTPSQLPVPVCPDWLLNLISDQRSPKLRAGNPIPEGRRNSTLASLAGAMRKHGTSFRGIRAALLVENLERCQPSLDESEVVTIAASVSQYQPDRTAPTQAEDENSTPIDLPFRTAAEIERETPAQVAWIARPLVAAGASTELAGKVKLAGKTTFTHHMVRAVLDGIPFMGQKTQKTAVIYLTEQSPTSFREAMKRAGLLGRDDFVVLFWKDTIGISWLDVMQRAVSECKQRNAKLLVVDTLTQFTGIEGDSENNAGDALAATQPLQQATAEGIGTLHVRHERKSGGAVGDSGRGSSAYAGAVDIVLSLRRPEGNHKRNVRLLHAVSRFDETPEQQLIELTDEGFRSLGEPGDVAIEQEGLKITAALRNGKGNALDIEALCDATEMSRAQLQRRLDELLNDGKIRKTGRGRRGDAFRYFVD